MQPLHTENNAHRKSHNLSSQKITQPLHTKNHRTSPHRKSRNLSQKSCNLSTQKITQPLYTENHATSPHRKSCNLSTQKVKQPLHTENYTTFPHSKSCNLGIFQGVCIFQTKIESKSSFLIKSFIITSLNFYWERLGPYLKKSTNGHPIVFSKK